MHFPHATGVCVRADGTPGSPKKPAVGRLPCRSIGHNGSRSAGIRDAHVRPLLLLTFPFLEAERLHCGCIGCMPCSGLRAAALRVLWPHIAARPGAAGLEVASPAPIASLWKAQQMFPCSAQCSSSAIPRGELKRAGDRRGSVLELLKRGMKSFFFNTPPSSLLWVWHLYLFTRVIFSWNGSSVWGRNSLSHSTPSLRPQSRLCWVAVILPAERFKPLVQAEGMPVRIVHL